MVKSWTSMLLVVFALSAPKSVIDVLIKSLENEFSHRRLSSISVLSWGKLLTE